MEAEVNLSKAAKVLNTAELLELIISHVQPECIKCLETVSKAWKELIRSSPTIQEQIKPLISLGRTLAWNAVFPETPVYKYVPRIAIHPALDPHTIQLVDDGAVTLRAGIYEASPPGLLKIRHEFATRPLVQELQVCHRAYLVEAQNYPRFLRSVWCENGVRIRHLLRACSELSREYRELKKALPHLQRRVPEERGNDFVVQLQQRMSREGMEAFKSANASVLQSGLDGWFDLKKEWPVVAGMRKIKGPCKDDSDSGLVMFRGLISLNSQAPVTLTNNQGNS